METDEEEDRRHIHEGVCPVCGSKLAHREACVECPACGWGLCSEA